MSSVNFFSENYFLFYGGILFLIWGIAIFCFGRISVKHIENEMAKEGKSPPVWDKGIGGRLAAYSTVILFPNINKHASLVDVESTLRHARKIDWVLAFFIKVSFYFFIIVIGIGYFLYAPDS